MEPLLLQLQRAVGNSTITRLLSPAIAQRQAIPHPASAGPGALPTEPGQNAQTAESILGGDPEALAALESTRTLPARVQAGGGARPLATDQQRAHLLRAGRDYFGSYAATIDHFAGIEQANVPGRPFVHRDARAALEAVAVILGADMPSTTVAFAFRKNFSARTHFTPASMHTLGYALDYDAYNMPRLGRGETAELIETTTGQSSHENLGEYGPRRATMRAMGEATAGGRDVGASGEALLSAIGSETDRLARTSTAFQQSLGPNRDAFLEVRTRYFEAPADQREAILAEVPPLIAPWTTAIDQEIAALQAGQQSRSQRDRAARLASLRGMLTNATFLFGSAARRGRPRPGTAAVVDTPSVSQLLERGFFNPGGGGGHFDASFITEMARHGFDVGSSWGGGSTDSMHFEYVNR